MFRKRVSRATAAPGRALQSFSDLRTGDYVVHEDHGIAQLLSFETKEVAGVTRDYLLLAFRGDDRVYVPHEQIGKVSRYVGADARSPTLSKLGGKAWDNLKSRAREHLREMAGDLMHLYAERQTRPGFAYAVDHEWLERLEEEFPYRETDDQRTAIESVKEDLEAPRPMDRLVCGDVGFGKTEVALRAAFAVAVNGKQVLMLVPTTVLAQQHWNTFRERYRDFPVRVEMASRFRKPAEVKRVLAEFNDGKVEVLIGTHRVLGRDVVPKELGLVIVDEEQRFGVAQKELLRQLRLEVDVLSLSATPIPRTLHMSLAGLRDISVIETPPEGRRPIRTYVGEYDDELIKSALEREVARQGQAFYLHNRVETIDEAADRLRQLCPELRFIVGHGQMAERELEDQMLKFLAGDADVLVSTTIIESGLDIPQANTLIVERADQLGLAQLYQIRGRVGRSDVLAHAYLFYPDATELTSEARARLATLADHTELGAGFAIAMRDLEIRGAGDLLGAEQSGHVAALGFELYVEMLHEAVAELQGVTRRVTRPVRVDARIDAYVPAAYIAAEALKIDLHRRIALVENEDELHELRISTEDRFGPLPEPVANLFAIQEAKLKLAVLGADFLVFRGGRASVGPVVLGSGELRALRERVETAVYSSGNREVTLRGEDFRRGARVGRCYAGRAPSGLNAPFLCIHIGTREAHPSVSARSDARSLRQREERDGDDDGHHSGYDNVGYHHDGHDDHHLDRGNERIEDTCPQRRRRRRHHARPEEFFNDLLAQAKQSVKEQGQALPKQGTTGYQTFQGPGRERCWSRGRARGGSERARHHRHRQAGSGAARQGDQAELRRQRGEVQGPLKTEGADRRLRALLLHQDRADRPEARREA